MSYTVERHKYGVVLKGPIPASDMIALLRCWEEDGFDTVDSALATALGATMVVTTKEGSDKWREEVEARKGAAHG